MACASRTCTSVGIICRRTHHQRYVLRSIREAGDADARYKRTPGRTKDEKERVLLAGEFLHAAAAAVAAARDMIRGRKKRLLAKSASFVAP